ncbi:MAG TPA: hypothetical protein VGD09_18200, partial [Blastococcus sp.]
MLLPAPDRHKPLGADDDGHPACPGAVEVGAADNLLGGAAGDHGRETLEGGQVSSSSASARVDVDLGAGTGSLGPLPGQYRADL